MPENWDLGSAITVRLGIVAGGVLGGFAGSWVGTMRNPAGAGVPTWPVVAGAVAGFATAWAVLTWLARRHRGAGVIAGGVLTLAAVVALLARFAWP
jgi:hypothetical protein